LFSLDRVVSDEDEIHEIYSAAMVFLDELWSARGGTYLEFPNVFNEFQQILKSALASLPSTHPAKRVTFDNFLPELQARINPNNQSFWPKICTIL
jgi:hypothetical protein